MIGDDLIIIGCKSDGLQALMFNKFVILNNNEIAWSENYEYNDPRIILDTLNKDYHSIITDLNRAAENYVNMTGNHAAEMSLLKKLFYDKLDYLHPYFSTEFKGYMGLYTSKPSHFLLERTLVFYIVQNYSDEFIDDEDVLEKILTKLMKPFINENISLNGDEDIKQKLREYALDIITILRDRNLYNPLDRLLEAIDNSKIFMYLLSAKELKDDKLPELLTESLFLHYTSGISKE